MGNSIEKIINNQDLKTVQFDIRNDTATEQSFLLFDTNTLNNVNNNQNSIVYSSPNDIIPYSSNIPTATRGAIFIADVNKTYSSNNSANQGGIYIENFNTNTKTCILPYVKASGYVYNTNNQILYVYYESAIINTFIDEYFITLIDTTSDSIIDTFSCSEGLQPNTNSSFSFCVTDNCIYYLKDDLQNLYRFDCNTNTGSTLSFPNIDLCYAIQYNNLDNKLYAFGVFNGYSSYDSVIINPANNQIEQTFNNSIVPNINAVTFCETNNGIYILNNSGTDISLYDCNTNNSILIYVGYNTGRNITYNPYNNCVYIITSDVSSNIIYVLDCTNNLIVDTITSLDTTSFSNCFISFYKNNQLIICWFDTTALGLWEGIDSITNNNYIYNQSQNEFFSSLTLSTKQELIYVLPYYYPQLVYVYDYAYNLITTIATTYNPLFGLYNPILNQVLIYNTIGADIIDCSNNTIIQTILFTDTATGGVFNINNNKYYLNSADYYFTEIDGVTFNQNKIITPYETGFNNDKKITLDIGSNLIYSIDNSNNLIWSYDINNNISSIVFDYSTLNYELRTITLNYINGFIYCSFINFNTSQYGIICVGTNSQIISETYFPVNNLIYNDYSNLSFNIYNNTLLYSYKVTSLSNVILTFNCVNNEIQYTRNVEFNDIKFNPINGKYYSVSGTGFSGSRASFITTFIPQSNVYFNGGSIDYNYFVQTLIDDPKLIYSLLIKMPQRFLANPLNVIYTDANGESNTTPYLPNTDIDIYQKSANRGSILFDEGLVIDVNTQIQIIIPPYTTVILLIDYKEFLKSDLLDLIIENNNEKAKYIISENLGDRKIVAKKYWGSISMPKEMTLDKSWLKDMKNRFSKVEVLENDVPKLSGGTPQLREMYQDLFGFKKIAKKKFIGITKPPEITNKKEIKLTSKKKTIKPKAKSKVWLKNISK